MEKFSAEPNARPPETTREAACKSGRSDLPCCRLNTCECVFAAAAVADSMLALPPVAAAAHDAARMVATTVRPAGASTVMMALPA